MDPKSMKFTGFLTITLSIFLDKSQQTLLPGEQVQPLSPQYIVFLEQCQERMDDVNGCQDEIVEALLRNATISKPCCSTLVNTGPDCHRAMVSRERDLIMISRAGERGARILSRSEELWKSCRKMVPGCKKKSYPRLPARKYLPGYGEFLRGCARRLTKGCGAEFGDAVVKDSGTVVSRGCCMKLLEMGKECHEELVKELVDHAEGRREGVGRKDRVWNHCKNVTMHD